MGILKTVGSFSPTYGALTGKGNFGFLQKVSPTGQIVKAIKDKDKKPGEPDETPTAARKGGKLMKKACSGGKMSKGGRARRFGDGGSTSTDDGTSDLFGIKKTGGLFDLPSLSDIGKPSDSGANGPSEDRTQNTGPLDIGPTDTSALKMQSPVTSAAKSVRSGGGGGGGRGVGTRKRTTPRSSGTGGKADDNAITIRARTSSKTANANADKDAMPPTGKDGKIVGGQYSVAQMDKLVARQQAIKARDDKAQRQRVRMHAQARALREQAKQTRFNATRAGQTRLQAMKDAKAPGASAMTRGKGTFYEENPGAMRKGGGVKKFAKGGAIDGIARRGKTRCKKC